MEDQEDLPHHLAALKSILAALGHQDLAIDLGDRAVNIGPLVRLQVGLSDGLVLQMRSSMGFWYPVLFEEETQSPGELARAIAYAVSVAWPEIDQPDGTC